jgi:hypothetical protein
MKTIKFNLQSNYKLMEAGEKVVTLTKVEPSPSGNPTDIKITYTDASGATIQEKINLDRALWKISRIAEAILKIKDEDEMDIAELCKVLEGKQIKVEVTHNQGTKPRDDGTFATFANVSKILGGVEEESASTAPAKTENPRSSILAGL